MLRKLIDALSRIANPNQTCDYKLVASCALIDTGATTLKTGSGGGVEFGYTATEGGKAASTLYLYLDNAERCIEFAEILQRSLNTWEPEKRPEWAMDILDKLTGMPVKVERVKV